MAKYWYQCPACKKKNPDYAGEHLRGKGKLFNALMELAQRGAPARRCKKCAGVLELRCEFPFALGAEKLGQNKVVAAGFMPEHPTTWKNKDGRVEWFPFLVVLEDSPRTEFCSVWLPYFHKDGQVIKFGQFAPYLGQPFFTHLADKLEKYLKTRPKPLADIAESTP